MADGRVARGWLRFRDEPEGVRVATILAVDDDPTIQQLLVVNLELEGYDVIVASDGEEALERIRKDKPDAVLLDVMMPRMDGMEVCKAAKADPETASIPIVILSAKAQQDDIAQGADVGADAYLTKPFDPLDLIETVQRFVG
jgi:CheY-like chemotaxis protein